MDEQRVLMLLEHCTPLIRRMAHENGLDFEDLYQDCSVTVMKVLAAPVALCDDDDRLRAYAWVAVRNCIITKIKWVHAHLAASLDAAFTLPDDAEGRTLLDLLPSPYAIDPVAWLISKERLEELQEELNPLILAKRFKTRRLCGELQQTMQAALTL